MTPERKQAVIAELQRRFGELMSERLDAIGEYPLNNPGWGEIGAPA
jgi:hypothetical protein